MNNVAGFLLNSPGNLGTCTINAPGADAVYNASVEFSFPVNTIPTSTNASIRFEAGSGGQNSVGWYFIAPTSLITPHYNFVLDSSAPGGGNAGILMRGDRIELNTTTALTPDAIVFIAGTEVDTFTPGGSFSLNNVGLFNWNVVNVNYNGQPIGMVVFGAGAPATNPPDVTAAWFYYDTTAKKIYAWNPDLGTQAWETPSVL